MAQKYYQIDIHTPLISEDNIFVVFRTAEKRSISNAYFSEPGSVCSYLRFTVDVAIWICLGATPGDRDLVSVYSLQELLFPVA